MESDKAKLLWDFSTQKHYEIQSRRPDIVILDKEENCCFIVDISVPRDARIAEKEKEKIEKKYQDLRREITRLWNTKAYVVPVVVGSLGMIPKNLKQHLETIGVTIKVEVLQKAALLVTGKLLRKVMVIFLWN